MSFARLREAGASLSPESMRVALVLALAGYGLKVGLFPLHTWKPDAYAAAPAPVSGLLAGAAVAVPLAAVLRYGALASAAGLGGLTSDLFVAAGLLSVLAAMILVLRERDLRRMLAFTSVEHMGLVLLACGLEPAAVRGGLFHLLTNGTLKALAFAVIGFAVLERGSGDTQSGPGLYGRSFALSALLLVCMGAALGFPPFGMFASEIAVLGALFSAGHVALGLVVALALAAIFGVVAAGTLRLVFARSDDEAPPAGRRGDAVALSLPILVGMAWIGVALPAGIWERIGDVARGLAP
jgi:hydrogenase-4 component F